MKRIPLSGGPGSLCAVVDDRDYERLCAWGWVALLRGRVWYAYGSSPEGIGEFMHIAVLGRKKGLVIDHINGDGLLNVRRNLRHVTQAQNSRNTYRHRDAIRREMAFSASIASHVAGQFKRPKRSRLAVDTPEPVAIRP
jgi:hypothetical protein